MLVQQYLPQILDLIAAASTDSICQQIGLCSVEQATTDTLAAVSSVLRNSDSTSAAQEDLVGSRYVAHFVLNV